MPHVVLEDAPNLAEACRALAPFTRREGAEILRLLDVFINQAGRTALLDCVVIEPGAPARSFFVQLSQKDRQITVRLLPATDPEKTIGVKRLLGAIAGLLRDAIPGSHYGKTNLQDVLSV
jgi:hypothetical protein